ncbi:MAG: hypothetical protein ABIR30_02075 [Chitinophagaceae bacterium]
MKRVIVAIWKDRAENSFEVFSNLKLFCASYPDYSYNTLNNYLSKSKVAYENDKMRIERKVVHTAAIPQRKIIMVAMRVSMRQHNDEAADLAYWLSRPVGERLAAATRLSGQLKKKGQLMDKTHVVKRRMKR